MDANADSLSFLPLTEAADRLGISRLKLREAIAKGVGQRGATIRATGAGRGHAGCDTEGAPDGRITAGGGCGRHLYRSDIAHESKGRVWSAKVPSTPADSSIGVLNGIEKICHQAGIKPSEISEVMHGTTVATNTVQTGSGARVGLVTTKG